MYFKNVKELIEYASDDIERFNSFEFKYVNNESYNIVRNCDAIKEINENTFEFNNIIFDLDLVEPLC